MGPLTSMLKSRTKGACDAQSARKMRQINPYTSDSLTVRVKVCGGVCAAMCIAADKRDNSNWASGCAETFSASF